jgi:hypothetical protein
MDINTVIKIAFHLMILWYLIFLAGTIQFRLIKKKTRALVQEKAKNESENATETSFDEIYNSVYPGWCEMVRKTAWFIPSKSELRPIPASIENVKRRLNFSPLWVKSYLEKQDS